MGLVVHPNIHGERRWSLSDPLLRFSKQGDILTLGQVCNGGAIGLGGTGSGKTSSIGLYLPLALMKLGCGFCILVTNPDAVHDAVNCARLAGCENRVKVFGPGDVFNFVDYEAKAHGGFGYAVIENLIETITTALDSVRRNRGQLGASGDGIFFEDSRDILLKNGSFTSLMANAGLDLSDVMAMCGSLPGSRADLDEPDRLHSLRTLAKAKKNTPAERQGELDLAIRYFEEEQPRLSDKTQSSIVAEAMTILDPFQREPLKSLTSGESTMTPDTVLDGAIVIINIPFDTHFVASKIIQTIWKRAMQRAVKRRAAAWKGVEDGMRPICLLSDDGHVFANRHDLAALATGRHARLLSLFYTQGISSLANELGKEAGGGKSLVDEFLMNLQCKFFCQNSDPDTNEYASKLAGDHLVKRSGGGTSQRSGGSGQTMNQNANWSQVWERWIRPEKFRSLRMGGKKNGDIVEVVVMLPGVEAFRANHKPYLKVQFHQIGRPGQAGPPEPIKMWMEKRPTARVWVNPVPWWKVVPFYDWADFWAPNW